MEMARRGEQNQVGEYFAILPSLFAVQLNRNRMNQLWLQEKVIDFCHDLLGEVHVLVTRCRPHPKDPIHSHSPLGVSLLCTKWESALSRG